MLQTEPGVTRELTPKSQFGRKSQSVSTLSLGLRHRNVIFLKWNQSVRCQLTAQWGHIIDEGPTHRSTLNRGLFGVSDNWLWRRPLTRTTLNRRMTTPVMKWVIGLPQGSLKLRAACLEKMTPRLDQGVTSPRFPRLFVKTATGLQNDLIVTLSIPLRKTTPFTSRLPVQVLFIVSGRNSTGCLMNRHSR